jgi:hypothetical protein
MVIAEFIEDRIRTQLRDDDGEDASIFVEPHHKILAKTQQPVLYTSKQQNIFTQWLFPDGSQNLAASLVDHRVIAEGGFVSSEQVNRDYIESFHTPRYVTQLESSKVLAQIFNYSWMEYVPVKVLNWLFVKPLLYQTGASCLAGELALLYGYAICIGGAMQHSYYDGGCNGSVFADISLSIRNVLQKKLVRKVMVIDLSAFQSTGCEIDKLNGKFGNNEDVYIIDVYNAVGFPQDNEAKSAINQHIKFARYLCKDDQYLNLVRDALIKSLEFRPDIIYYNGGTHHHHISELAISRRDEAVFRYALQREIPIVMFTGQCNKICAGASLRNLFRELNLDSVSQLNYERNTAKMQDTHNDV